MMAKFFKCYPQIKKKMLPSIKTLKLIYMCFEFKCCLYDKKK